MAYTLKPNQVYTVLSNLVISVTARDPLTRANNVLCEEARVDGGQYGDTKVYVDQDVPYDYDFLQGQTAINHLSGDKGVPNRNVLEPFYNDVAIDEIVVDKFRQVAITTFTYLSKAAWGTKGAFDQFTNFVRAQLQKCRDMYDYNTYNVFIGTEESAVGKQKRTVDISTVVGSATGEEANRLEAAAIMEDVANLKMDLKDYTTDYSDNQFPNAWDPDTLRWIFASSWYAKIQKRDLASYFNKDFVEKLNKYVINDRFMGKINAVETVGDGTKVRARFSMILAETAAPTKLHALRAGDLIPATCKAPANMSYTYDPTIIYKVNDKRGMPIMSSFTTTTSFFNARSLEENNYLTWSHNTLKHLNCYPCITVRKKA